MSMTTSTLPQYHNTSYSNISTKRQLSPATLLLCHYIKQHLFSYLCGGRVTRVQLRPYPILPNTTQGGHWNSYVIPNTYRFVSLWYSWHYLYLHPKLRRSTMWQLQIQLRGIFVILCKLMDSLPKHPDQPKVNSRELICFLRKQRVLVFLRARVRESSGEALVY